MGFIKEQLYKIKKFFLNNCTIFTVKYNPRKCVLPNRLYVPQYYKKRMGRTMDLKNPKEISEKLNWYKVYYHDPLLTLCADKYRMREYVKMVLGEGYTVPLLGKWESPNEIDFEALPDRFVLKTNHDGGPIVCQDKSQIDKNYVINKLKQKLKSNYYRRGRTWSYKNIKRCVFAEEFLDLGDEELVDYRFFCFNGIVKYICTTSEKTDAKHGHTDYFDAEFNKLPFCGGSGCAAVTPLQPANFEEMKKIAEQLASYGDGGIPFVRVDMYAFDDKIYIGELTFYPTNGMVNYNPKEWNKIIGDYFVLPKKNGWKKQSGRDDKWIKTIINQNEI